MTSEQLGAQPSLAASRHYVLTLLAGVMIFNYVDRVAMGLFLPQIKQDLALSDTQLGFLTGIAFAAFYATMGIPIARWADHGNRVRIISLTATMWSVAVALCSLPAKFSQLLMLRMCVAIGEAGCHPPAFSLLSDYFEPREHPRAISRYMLGWPLALLFGYFAGGWLSQIYGWRVAFVLLGVPGVLLGALVAFTVREPRTRSPMLVVPTPPPPPTTPQPQASLRRVLKELLCSPSYRNLLLAFSLSYFFANGILQWLPSFFSRSDGLSSAEVGMWLALIYGVGGLLGTWAGGELAARYAAGNQRLQFRALSLLYCALAVLSTLVYLAPNYQLALTALVFSSVGSAIVTGPMFAATQDLVPARLRATSVALVLLTSNLIGLGLGPLAAGALSDLLRPRFGADGLRFALLALSPGYFGCAWFLWRAQRAHISSVSVAREFA